ncbi:MAG: tetratricopeptide repeat protein [Saprospiraceae bacterium]
MKYCILSSLLCISWWVGAQLPGYGNHGWKEHISTMASMEDELYGNARLQLIFSEFINQRPAFPNPDRVVYIQNNEEAISSLRLQAPEAETRLVKWIQSQYNKAGSYQAILELASYYYNNGRYDEAITYYDKISDFNQLSDLELSELSFKKGYCHFVNKQFGKAKTALGKTREIRDIYFHHTNYYYGMCQYFEKDYNGAVESFKRASNASEYAGHIPYIIAQIYFAQRDFDKLISYGEHKIGDKNTDNLKDIRLLLGQAYFLKNDYKRALPHLEFYESRTEKLSAEEFYQLAFCQYKLGDCEKAKSNFLELSNLDSRMGQMANYYLADCYIRLNDRNSARSAFRKVSAMDYDTGMQEEARFNYGKISAELGSEREAINALVETQESSRFFGESQEIINDILVNSTDYLNSLRIIEGLPKASEKINKTYQMIALRQALQYLEDGNTKDAGLLLDKSLTQNKDRNYRCQALFWKGRLAYDAGDLAASINFIDQYFEASNGVSDLPEASAQYMAHYIQGYNFLKTRIYKKAELQFKNAVVGININREGVKNDFILNRILPDAYIRTADCMFRLNQYEGALDFYEQAIARKQGAFVYAIYQKSLIHGLLNEPQQKISALVDLTKNHASSDYADDAYYQLGETYMERQSLDTALVYYQQLIKTFPGKSAYLNQARLKSGLIYYNKSDNAKALAEYKTVMKSNPSPLERATALSAIEEIYVDRMANSKSYLKYLDSLPATEKGSMSLDSLTFHLAMNIFNNGQYDAAATAFTEYLSDFPIGYYKNDARYYRAESNNVLKNYPASLQDYELIINDGDSRFTRKSIFKAALIAYHYTEDFSKALKYYKLSETVAGDPAEIFQAQYGALKSSFRLSLSDDIFTYGKKVISNTAATKDERASANYYLAKTYLKINDTDNALPSLSYVEQNSSNNQAAESRYLLAEIYFNQKKWDEAEQQCNYANEKNGNYPYWIAKSLLLLSDIYYQKDDLLNARAAIEAVLENFTEDKTIVQIANEKLNKIKVKEAENNRIKSSNEPFDLQKKTKNDEE